MSGTQSGPCTAAPLAFRLLPNFGEALDKASELNERNCGYELCVRTSLEGVITSEYEGILCCLVGHASILKPSNVFTTHQLTL